MSKVSIIIPSRNEPFAAKTVADVLPFRPWGYVYLATNTQNACGYVGQTKNTILQRWKGHCRDSAGGRATPMATAIREFGSDSFEVRQVGIAISAAHLSLLEEIFIGAYKTQRPQGYNVGHARVYDSETIEKMRRSKLGKRPWNKGIPLTESTRRAISKANAGRLVGRVRGPMPDATKEKLRLANTGKPGSRLGRKCSDAHKAALSAARKGKPGNPHTQEFKDRLSQRNRGNKWASMIEQTPERRARISAMASARERDEDGTWL